MPCDPFVLKIIFHGLLAFVVPVPDQTGNVPEVWAIMVDATDIRTVPAQFFDLNRCARTCDCSAVHVTDMLHQHRAAIRYRSKNVDPQGDESFRLWLLDGYDLELDPANGNEPVAIANGRLPNSERPALADPRQVEDFSWVPAVDLISKRLGRVHPDVTGSNPEEELRERVAGRIKLNGGRLRTRDVSVETLPGGTQARLFEFKPKIHGKAFRQALAESVEYSSTVNDCEIKVLGSRFGDNTNVKSLTLKPKEGEKEVVIEMINVQDDFLLAEHFESDEIGSLGGENFLWFYKLSSGNLGPFPIPAFPGGPITGKPYCPMATFLP